MNVPSLSLHDIVQMLTQNTINCTNTDLVGKAISIHTFDWLLQNVVQVLTPFIDTSVLVLLSSQKISCFLRNPVSFSQNVTFGALTCSASNGYFRTPYTNIINSNTGIH